MRAGLFDGVIDIEHRVITGVSAANEPIYEWRVWRDDIFVGVKAKRGREHWDEGTKQRYSETVTEFRAHLTDVDGLDHSMRIKYEGQYYDIKTILPDHTKRQDCLIDATVQGATVQGEAFELFAEPVLVGEVGEAYQTLITVIGGTAPVTLGLANEGSPSPMPTGLNLVQAQEKVWSLEGFPGAIGSYPIEIVATDADGKEAILDTFTLVIS